MDGTEVVSLDELKVMLRLNNADQDDLLKLIIKNTVKQARFKIGIKPADDFPNELAYIPLEVSVRRYNRVRNEGMKSYSQEGETLTFRDNDFDDFLDDIDVYQERNDINPQSRGKIKFINAYGANKKCDTTR